MTFPLAAWGSEVRDELIVYLEGNPMVAIIAIIVVSAPTEMSKPTVKDTSYNDLRECLWESQTTRVRVVLGDFNARLGQDKHHINPQLIGCHVYHNEINDNRKRMVNLLYQTQMRHLRFPHKSGRQWMFLHANVTSKANLDHTLVYSK